MKRVIIVSDDSHTQAWVDQALAGLDLQASQCPPSDMQRRLLDGAADLVILDGGRSPEVLAQVAEHAASGGVDLRLLDLFHRLGVRMGGLAHNRRNAWSDGTQYHTATGGLTPLGKQAVRRMNELGIVVDVGHLTAAGFWETLEASNAPVVLSHRSPRKFFPLRSEDSPFDGIYDLSRGKERLEALARNGGVFGVFFLGAKNVEDVVADIEYVIGLVGPDHVGLGSDLYGTAQAPKGLEDMSGLPAITRALVARGHCDEDILKILGGNFLRVFRQVLDAPPQEERAPSGKVTR